MPKQDDGKAQPKKGLRIKNQKKRILIPLPAQLQRQENSDLFDVKDEIQDAEEILPEPEAENPYIEYFNESNNASIVSGTKESLDDLFKRSISKFKQVDTFLQSQLSKKSIIADDQINQSSQLIQFFEDHDKDDQVLSPDSEETLLQEKSQKEEMVEDRDDLDFERDEL